MFSHHFSPESQCSTSIRKHSCVIFLKQVVKINFENHSLSAIDVILEGGGLRSLWTIFMGNIGQQAIKGLVPFLKDLNELRKDYC
jgi:hypothetical protein